MWIVEYIKNTTILIILGKCIINLLPKKQYEPYVKISLGMILILYLFSNISDISISLDYNTLKTTTEVEIQKSENYLIQKGIEKYVYEDLILNFSEESILKVSVKINTDDNVGRIEEITVTFKFLNLDKQNELRKYLESKYQLKENQIKLEYKGE